MALTYEDLWNKSKTLIERALAKRDEGLFDEFQLWAAITLELLGKATLARIHPALVVNPDKFEYLLVACGHTQSSDYKTIMATTLFERCRRVVKDFDKVTEEFCVKLANRRNADLHSGEIPFTGISIQTWQPKYWQVIRLLLNAQGKTLPDYIGAKEAAAAEEIIKNASAALAAAIEGRIRRHHALFEEMHPARSQEQVREHARVAVSARIGSGATVVSCPACNSPGILAGRVEHEDEIGPDDDEPWLMEVRRFYGSETFECIVCGLKLSGIAEITPTDVPVEFENVEFEEIDYEPEYGND
jgi:hypothetical protein